MIHDYGSENNGNLKLLVVLGRTIQGLARQLMPGIRATGLTQPQFEVLEALYHKGPLTVSEIIEKTLSTSGNITVVIDNLVKAKLAEKARDADDGRVRWVSATDSGRAIIADFFPRHIEELANAMSVLSSEEKDALTGLLKKLGKSLPASQ